MAERCIHGGDIYKHDIDLDYSICVNPLGMPESAKKAYAEAADLLESYPDPECTKLRERVAMLERHERIGLDGMHHTWGRHWSSDIRAEELVFGNGAAELIYALCQALRPKHVYLTEPGFGEYERAAAAAGAELHFLKLTEERDFYMPGDGSADMRTSSLSKQGDRAGSAEVHVRLSGEASGGTRFSMEKAVQMAEQPGEPGDAYFSMEKAVQTAEQPGEPGDAYFSMEKAVQMAEQPEEPGKMYFSLEKAAHLAEYPEQREETVVGESPFDLTRWLGTEPGSLVFLSNPLHPTGTLIRRDLLKAILSHCERHGLYLCVDECFLDLCPDFEGRTLKPYLDAYPHLVILRAFTKVYAMPGLRLGYLISASPALRDSVKSVLQPWNISVPAQEAGYAAISDPFYQEHARELIVREKKYLCEELMKNGFAEKIYRSAANYIFFRTKPGLFEKMLSQRILIRTFRDDRGLDDRYCRISIKSHKENEELIKRWKIAADR